MLTMNMKRLSVAACGASGTGYMGQLLFPDPAIATSGLPRC
jgi:hypothetical protein